MKILSLILSALLIPGNSFAAIVSTVISTDTVHRTGDTMSGTLTNPAGFVGPLTGNASTATSVPQSGVNLSTVTTALAGKLSNTSAVPSNLIDLSTVTTALAGKLSNTAAVPANLIDLSTVTTALAGKLSNTSAVPANLIDLSTVTTALAGKQNSFVGVSSSCASGFYWNSGTWVNGVQTGGSCTASGGGGGSGHTISSSSGTAGSTLTTFSQRTGLDFGPGFTLSDDLGKDATRVNMTTGNGAMTSTKTIITTDQTFTGGGWTTFAASSVTIVSGNNKLMVLVSGTISDTGSGQVPQIAVFLDGQYIDAGQASGRGCASSREPGAGSIAYFPFQCTIITDTPVSAGSHTVQIGGRTTGSTGRMRCGTGTPENAAACYVQVVELGVITPAISVPASSSTLLTGSFTGDSTSKGLCVAGSTVTWTHNGGSLRLTLSNFGLIQGTGSDDARIGFLVNGDFLAPWKANQDGAMYNSFDATSLSNTGGNSFSVLAENISAGSKSACVSVWRDGGSSATLSCNPADSGQGSCWVGAEEVRNVAGTGDVASNANNTFSGTNTFTGQVNFQGVEVSTISANLAGISFPIQAVFNVAVATLTYVAGSNPIEVCYSGSMVNNQSGPTVNWSFLVDGAFVNGLSSTVGVLRADSYTTGISANASACYLIKAGVVSSGSHQFALTVHGGNNTGTLGCGGSCQALFSVRAVR